MTPGSGSSPRLGAWKSRDDGCGPLEDEHGRNWPRDFSADGETSWQFIQSQATEHHPVSWRRQQKTERCLADIEHEWQELDSDLSPSRIKVLPRTKLICEEEDERSVRCRWRRSMARAGGWRCGPRSDRRPDRIFKRHIRLQWQRLQCQHYSRHGVYPLEVLLSV